MLTLRRLPSRTLRGIFGIGASAHSTCSRRSYSKGIIEENDIVLLEKMKSTLTVPILTGPLLAGKTNSVELVRDTIAHDAILGKAIRDVVTSRKGIWYRILQPTLGEYTDICPRLVTPIYSQDASLIVSMLDLDPTIPDPASPEQDRLEIFEAGTGHGALTLHLARAIHWANTPLPKRPVWDEISLLPLEVRLAKKEAFEKAYAEWRRHRRAVIHTLDSSSRHLDHARTVIKNFRQGIYYPHIDFHNRSIDEYLSSRLVETSNTPFMDHAILDLPTIHQYLEIVEKALKPNGTLITFCPSITQITEAVMFVRHNSIPLFLEKVVEVGSAAGVGGREWDVRPVKPRALLKPQVEALGRPGSAEEMVDALKDASEDSKVIATEPSVSETPTPDDSGWKMVCRPKVGLRTSGGGFVGLWRKMTEAVV